MSLKVILLIAVPMFVICCAILLKYWDRLKKPPKQQRCHRKIEKVPETVITIEKVPETVLTIERMPETVITICHDAISDNQNEAEAKMEKPIFISADCWLCVFDLLPPSQLGFGISMISRRFDYYVNEHFKTRRWALRSMQIRLKIGENGTNGMEITNLDGETLPIPQIQLPRKVIGFKRIIIHYIDRNAIAFLDRLRPIFASFPINLACGTNTERILDLIVRNTWPTLGKNFHGIESYPSFFHRLRHITPSMLNECPPLRFVSICYNDFFTEFPCDDNATASDGQAVAKWLFTPLQSNVPKVFKFDFIRDEWEDWPLKIDAFKAAFANASSPVNFIVAIWFDSSSFADSVVPFDLTNELTREQLTLKRMNDIRRVLLIRCPIARDESKWTKWEEEAIGWEFFDQWNKIDIHIDNEDNIGDELLDETPGPSDQQKK